MISEAVSEVYFSGVWITMGEPWQQTAAALVRARREAKAARWTARIAILVSTAVIAGWFTGGMSIGLIERCHALAVTPSECRPKAQDVWVSHAVEAVADLRLVEIERLRRELRAAQEKIARLERTARISGPPLKSSLAFR